MIMQVRIASARDICMVGSLYSLPAARFAFAGEGAVNADVVKVLQDLKNKDGRVPDTTMDDFTSAAGSKLLCKTCRVVARFLCSSSGEGGERWHCGASAARGGDCRAALSREAISTKMGHRS